MKKIIIIASLFLMVAFAPKTTNAQNVREAKLWVVKFHADWCPSCQAIEPEYTDLQDEFNGKPILFARFDFTNSFYSNQTYLMASAMGIGDIFTKYNSIGYMLLIDPKTKEIKGKLTSRQDLNQMIKEINAYL